MNTCTVSYNNYFKIPKIWLKKSGKIHKNREKILQFFGVNDFKIQWTVLEIKFIKGKTLMKNGNM